MGSIAPVSSLLDIRTEGERSLWEGGVVSIVLVSIKVLKFGEVMTAQEGEWHPFQFHTFKSQSIFFI